MKVRFEFDDIEDGEDIEIFMQSRKMYLVIWEYKQYLRNKIKHSDMTDCELVVHEHLREVFHEMLDDFKVVIE